MEIINEKNAAETAKAVAAGLLRQPGPSTVRRSASVGALAAALAKAQAELKNPPKDSLNPHFKSRYADLATVRDAVVPVLAKNGLAVVQLPCELDDAPALTTVLVHTSGEFYETTMKLRPLKNDPQGVGSALTYARRYALQALAGVAADDDDDGNAASQPPRQQQARPAVQPPASAAAEILAVLKTAQSRKEANKAWTQYAEGLDAGAFAPEEERQLKLAWDDFAKRFPKEPAKA